MRPGMASRRAVTNGMSEACPGAYPPDRSNRNAEMGEVCGAESRDEAALRTTGSEPTIVVREPARFPRPEANRRRHRKLTDSLLRCHSTAERARFRTNWRI